MVLPEYDQMFTWEDFFRFSINNHRKTAHFPKKHAVVTRFRYKNEGILDRLELAEQIVRARNFKSTALLDIKLGHNAVFDQH